MITNVKAHEAASSLWLKYKGKIAGIGHGPIAQGDFKDAVHVFLRDHDPEFAEGEWDGFKVVIHRPRKRIS